jgi:hypothetical protein
LDDDQFLKIIEDSRKAFFGASKKSQIGKLRKALADLPLEEVVAFDKIFHQKLWLSYTWDLWGAAYIIEGGCSDDGFDYFRMGLIAAGRNKFEQAMHDVESLANWVRPGKLEFEDVASVLYYVYNEKAGTRGQLPVHDFRRPSEPTGEPWEEGGDDLQRRFPKLWAKFGG